MSMDEVLGQGAPAPVRLSVPLKAYLARSFGPEQIGQFISPGADLSASGLINNLNGQVTVYLLETRRVSLN